MTKRQETALNIYTLIVLNLVFWICGNMPRRIVNFDDGGSFASYIVCLLYLALFAFFAVIAFDKDKTIFSEKVFDKTQSVAKRYKLGKLVALLFLQIGFDYAVALLSFINAQWKYIGFDIMLPIYWCVTYFICVGKRHLKKKNAKIFVFMSCLILCLTAVSLLITSFIISDYIGLIPKYQSDSSVLSAAKANAEFLYGVKTALLDTVIGISFLVMNRLLKKSEEKRERCNFTVFLSRMLVIGAVLFVSICLKTIYPDGLLTGFRIHTTNHTSYQYFGEVKESGNALMIYRLSSKREKTPYYQKDNITLSVDDKLSVELTQSYIGDLYPHYVKDNALDKEFFLYPVLSGETDAYIYNSQVICFYENEALCMIKVDDIKRYRESEILKRVCKKLLSEGNIYIYEYAVEYLERYEPDFVSDYTERYANGDFTEAELLWMQSNYYRGAYVKNLAEHQD
jgi:hypothetical protein